MKLNNETVKLKKKKAINSFKGHTEHVVPVCLIKSIFFVYIFQRIQFHILYLQLVELEQIAVERRQQTTLLQPEVRSPAQRYRRLGGADRSLRQDLPTVSTTGVKTDRDVHICPPAPPHLNTWADGSSAVCFVLWIYFCLSLMLIL